MIILIAAACVLALEAGPAHGAAYTVDTTSDASLTLCTGGPADCSLRGAISNAAASGAADTITFDPAIFPVAPPATITLGSALPDLSGDNDTIDGTGAGVIVDGVTSGFDCFTVSGGSNTITALRQITNCVAGVSITGAGNTIGGTNIDSDGDGLYNEDPLGDFDGDTTLDDDADTLIDEDPLEGGMILGPTSTGVVISGVSATGNTVLGNHLGGFLGAPPPSGNGQGVNIHGGAQNNTIGGTTAGERNVISGNNGGVVIEGAAEADTQCADALDDDADAFVNDGCPAEGDPESGAECANATDDDADLAINDGCPMVGTNTTGNTVKGNYIGTNAAGNAPQTLPNAGGVRIWFGAQNNTIGGTTAGERNVISGNSDAIRITGPATTGNSVSGNYIGTDAAGISAVPNGRGVVVDLGAQSNTIGGTSSGARNVISGNSVRGVEITGSGTDGNTVSANYIGTQADGSTVLGNTGSGVRIDADASNNTIGGTTVGERNILSGNGAYGVNIVGTGSYGNIVSSNFIGLDFTGTAPLGNTDAGVNIAGSGNTIGGAFYEGNVISANGAEGVSINGVAATWNTVTSNYIGTDETGLIDLGNTLDGVTIYGPTNNTVGPGNFISGNGGVGVRITGATTDSNTVKGNFIGINSDGDAAIANALEGVIVAEGSFNTVGGTIAGERNVISGNGASGIIIDGAYATGNAVSGNYIGTNSFATFGIPNSTGVRIVNGANSNTVGGTSAGESNTIAFNSSNGVEVSGAASTSNVIRGNSTHSNGGLGIDLSGDGVTENDGGDVDSGPNNLMNFPVITGASYDGVSTTITGTIDTIDASPTIDVYANEAADPSGNGEGQVYVGSTTASAGLWTLVVPGATTFGIFTATTTSTNPSTSEFSDFLENDIDGDGILSGVDNCDLDFNPLQMDHDGDGVGDACDSVVRNRLTADTSSIVAEFSIPAGQSAPSNERRLDAWDYESGSSINTGAIVGDIDFSFTVALTSGICSLGAYFPDITLLNAITDDSNGLIDTADVRLDLNTNGIPDGAEKLPLFLNTILDPERLTNVDEDGDGIADEDGADSIDNDADTLLDEDGVGTPDTLHARYFGEYGADSFVHVLVFEVTADSLYKTQVIFDDPTQPPAPGSLVGCAPIEIRTTTFDTSVANSSATPVVSGGDTVLITPSTPGTKVIDLQLVELADADGDGFENLLDNCPLLYNPGQDDSDADAIGNACEPVSGPCSATASADCDGDGHFNVADNCPLVANPGQEESEIRTPHPFGIPHVNDSIGDACDPNLTLVDDAGPPEIRRYSDPICVTGGGTVDGDGDGWCNDLDPNDGLPGVTPEDDSVAPGSCANGVDDDGDALTDSLDAACADADGDGVTDAADNCDGVVNPAAANPLQLDADADGVGDACESAIIATLQTVSVTGSANSELRGRLVEPAPTMLHERSGGVVRVTDADWFVASDAAVTNGAVRAALQTTSTMTLSPSHTCNNPLPVNFTLLDASTDTSQTVNAGTAFSGLLSDTNPANGLPDGVDKMPGFLLSLPRLDDDSDGLVDEDPANALDDDGDGLIDEDRTPYARLFGSAQLAGVNTVLNVLIYSPVAKDNDGDGLVDEDSPDAFDNDGDTLVDEDAQEGYEAVFISGDPTVTPNQGTISALCTPFEGRYYRYAVSLDNLATGAVDEGGTELLENSATGVTELFSTRVNTQPDWDGDLIENGLDTCFNEPDNDGDGTDDQSDSDPWNPRLVNPPGDSPGDTLPGNGIPDGCELPPPPPIQGAMMAAVSSCITSNDCDGDGINNTADNCLVVTNGPGAGVLNQSDTDGDGIGDACDPNTALPSGSVQQVVGGTPQCPSPPGTDLDKDGYCADIDPYDANVVGNDKKVPETSAFSTLVCDDIADNDSDSLVDLADPGCSDLDVDGVLNQFDNCPQVSNGPLSVPPSSQTDSDGDSAGGGHIGEQPFRRSSTGEPQGLPIDVVGEPFRRSDAWGGDACDPDDDNDSLPDGNEPPNCRLDPDCDDDLIGDYPDWIYSPSNHCFVFNDCLVDPPGAGTCLDATIFQNRVQNHDVSLDPPGDSLYTYGEILIGTNPCSRTPELELDPDSDNFNTGFERYFQTDPDVACPLTPTAKDEVDRWPPDFDDNRIINTTDVFKVLPPTLGSSLGSVNFTVRADLAPSGVINTTDVFKVLPPTLGSSCVP